MSQKLIIVTGVSSGIGFQTTKDLLNKGYRVIGISRACSEKVEVLLTEFSGQFYFESCDLSANIDDLPKLLVKLSKSFGRFSGLVHAAGVQQTLPLRVNSYQKMLDVFNINVFAGMALAKGVSDRRVCSENGASIVFLSSIASKTGAAGLVNYSASKAAVNGAMRAMAKELAPLNIRVNSVLPGFVKTEMIEQVEESYSTDFVEKIEEAYPLGIGSPEDVSNMIVFLLGEESKWTTGCEFNVNGGATLGGQE